MQVSQIRADGGRECDSAILDRAGSARGLRSGRLFAHVSRRRRSRLPLQTRLRIETKKASEESLFLSQVNKTDYYRRRRFLPS